MSIAALTKAREVLSKTKYAKEPNLLKRFRKNPQSRILAIHSECFVCVGGLDNAMPAEGWKMDIKFCEHTTCPLYSFRPYKPTKSQLKKNKP